MRKKTIGFATVFFAIAVALIMHAPVATADSSIPDCVIDGGRQYVTFDRDGDGNYFGLYSQFGKKPWILDGKMTCWVHAEQKLIAKGGIYSEVDVSVDIGTLNDHGKFNAGIYVFASGVSDALDGIDAWNVQLERAADQNTYYLKLHRFERGKWKGTQKEVSGLVLPFNEVNLRVVVKSEYLYAFVNHEQTPRLIYRVGAGRGAVGLRCYYSPNTFDNFSVISQDIPIDFSAVDRAVEQAEALDLDTLTQNSRTAVEEMIAEANNLTETAVNQYRVDEFAQEFAELLDELIIKHTPSELETAIARARALNDAAAYTENSWSAMRSVLEYCEQLGDDASEDEISYWTYRLERRIEKLIAYRKGVNA